MARNTVRYRYAAFGIAAVALLAATFAMGRLIPRRAALAEARGKLIEAHDVQAYYLRMNAIRETLNSEAAAELAEKWARRGRVDMADHYREAAALYTELAFCTRARARHSEARAVELLKLGPFDPAAEAAKDRAREKQDYEDDTPIREECLRVIHDWVARTPDEDFVRWREVIAETARRTQSDRGTPGLAAR